MSIFGDIMSGIFGHSASAAPSGPVPQTQTAPTDSAAKPTSQTTVDVAAVLDGLAKQKKQKLKWRTSIVDLMKLLDLDSSITARQHSGGLRCRADMKQSAKMNSGCTHR